MKKIFIPLVCLFVLLNNCDGTEPVPFGGSDDCIFFTDVNNNNLIEDIVEGYRFKPHPLNLPLM